ncbi:MAG: abortive infection system antitoxin AbiGi family protein [Clostridium sp.]
MEILSYKQSANTLFNFMEKLEWLKEIIGRQAIVPRYYEEDLKYLDIDHIKRIGIPMTCFCDINFSNISEHVGFYGRFGIGFDKAWCVEKGIQPIQYINDKSVLLKDYREALEHALTDDKNSVVENYLLTNLAYFKPLKGKMKKRDGSIVNKIFHDEKEWRYIPEIKKCFGEDLEQIVNSNHCTDKYLQELNEVLREEESKQVWLNFDLMDIKYLIVETERDKVELINYICDLYGSRNEEGYSINKLGLNLISNIIVYNNMGGDW